MREKSKIKIVIETFDDKRVLTQVKASDCTKADILEAMETAFLGTLKDCSRPGMSEEEVREHAKDFGHAMERSLIAVMLGKKIKSQRFDGKAADFMAELMRRQEEARQE